VSPLQRWTLTAVCVATAILMLDIAVVNTALPALAADLGTDLHALKWVIDAYALALGSVVLTAGSLADRFGRRRLYTLGVALFTLSSVACAAAPTIGVLNVARAVQGVGAAAMFSVSLALLANAFPSAAGRHGALATYGATIGASFAIGPFVGGVLTELFGWQWVFLLNVPIGAACLWMAAEKLRESRDPHPRRVDVPGQVTLIGGLFSLVFGLLRAAEHGWDDGLVLGTLGAAVALLAGFVAIEARTREPMLPLELLRRPGFAGAQVSAFAISAGLFAIFIYLMLYLQRVLGLSPIQAGLTIVPGTVLNLLCAAATQPLARIVRPATLVAGALALVTIGLGLMTLAGPDSSWLAIQPGFCLAMIGTGLFNPAVSALTLAVPEHQSGLASGIHDTARQAGTAVGVAALGTLIPAGAVAPAEFVDGFQDALLAGGALTAVAALVAARPRLRRASAEPQPQSR
jgi:EmrB/QacA subfamily drug resistance transporter